MKQSANLFPEFKKKMSVVSVELLTHLHVLECVQVSIQNDCINFVFLSISYSQPCA